MRPVSCPRADIRPPRRDEAVARAALQHHINGDLIFVDAPDFLLCRDGQVEGCVEVTTSTDERIRTLRGQLERHGRSFHSTELEGSWMVTLTSSADLRNIHRSRIVELLTAEETSNRHPADVPALKRRNRLRTEMRAIGINRAHELSPDRRAGQVRLIEPGYASHIDPKSMNRVAEMRIASKADVLSEMRGERHLFVWVDPFDPTGAGLVLGGSQPDPPGEPPKMPPWIHTVWLMSTFGPPRLWQSLREIGWTPHDVPSLALSPESG